MDKKCGSMSGEWRKGRRGGVVQKRRRRQWGSLGDQSNRLVVGNVPSKAVDALQHFII